MSDILDILKDDNEYYRGVGRNYLSNSDIGTLLNNPKMFGVPSEDNKAFAEGRYFHQLMIEPEKAKGLVTCDSATRTTKEYKVYARRISAFGEDVDALRIRDFVPKDVEVDVTKAIESINMCKTLDELKKTYMSLTKEEQGHPDVVKAKDNKKGGVK